MNRAKSLIGAAVLVVVGLSGCATSQSELVADESKKQVWEVEGSSETVFRTYKEYASEKHSVNSVFSADGGWIVSGYYYGPDAELSVMQPPNFLGQNVLYHFKFEKAEDAGKMLVTSWYKNSGWKDRVVTYKDLLPTRVISVGKTDK